MSAYLVDRLRVHPRVTVRCRSEVTRLDGGDFLEEVSITDRTADSTQPQPCSGLFCFIGAEPAASWLTGIAAGDDGFIRTDVQLNDGDLGPAWADLGRRPLPFETSIPGVFAVGDVHSGSMKASPEEPDSWVDRRRTWLCIAQSRHSLTPHPAPPNLVSLANEKLPGPSHEDHW
jgi:thioredoxin reductase